MIELLFREKVISEDEKYHELSGHIANTLDELTAQLREEDKHRLQRLCSHYIKREELMKELAYQEGFRIAIGIVKDIDRLLQK